MITRKDITQHRLDKLWREQGQQLQKYISVDPLPPAVVFEEYDSPYALPNSSADNLMYQGDIGGVLYTSGSDRSLGDDENSEEKVNTSSS